MKSSEEEQVGISVLADPDQVYAVGLVLDEKEIYQIPVGRTSYRGLPLWKAESPGG